MLWEEKKNVRYSSTVLYSSMILQCCITYGTAVRTVGSTEVVTPKTCRLEIYPAGLLGPSHEAAFGPIQAALVALATSDHLGLSAYKTPRRAEATLNHNPPGHDYCRCGHRDEIGRCSEVASWCSENDATYLVGSIIRSTERQFVLRYAVRLVSTL